MNDTGAMGCLVCSTEFGKGYWSSEGSAGCDQAAEGFYLSTQKRWPKPELCPNGVACETAGTTTQSMELTDGWFKFGAQSVEVYKCPFDNCVAPAHNASGAVGPDLCAKGSNGPLCAVCDPDHYLSKQKNSCQACSKGNGWLGPVVGLAMIFVVGAALVRYKSKLSAFATQVS